MTKPSSLEELVARIRIVLRRTGGDDGSSSLRFEDVELDEDTREVTRAGDPVDLTATEYGERRAADGSVLGHVELTYGQEPARRHPSITVSAKDGGDLHYRARATPSRGAVGLTVVAIPLNGLDERLGRLLLVEGLVIGGVLVLLALLSWFLVRTRLRPLDRIGETADAIAAGDLSRRVEVATPKTEVGRVGLAIVAGIVAVHRGSVRAANARGGGASFVIRLPLAD